MILMNGQSAPLEVNESESYVSATTRQQGEQGEPDTITQQTATLDTGLNVVVIPYISENNTVVVNVSLDTSQNLGFEVFETAGGESVQLPNTRSRSFINQVVVPSGATLVAVGYESKTTNSKKAGVGQASFFLLGGSNNSEIIRERLVIAITPTIIENHIPVKMEPVKANPIQMKPVKTVSQKQTQESPADYKSW